MEEVTSWGGRTHGGSWKYMAKDTVDQLVMVGAYCRAKMETVHTILPVACVSLTHFQSVLTVYILVYSETLQAAQCEDRESRQ